MSGWLLTGYGVLALTFMMAMYALEARNPRFVLAFGCGCLLASSYGFLSGAWPFGAVEAIWALVALRRFSRDDRRANRGGGSVDRRGTRLRHGAGDADCRAGRAGQDH